MSDVRNESGGPPIEWLDEVDSTQVTARERVRAGGLTEARGLAARVQIGGYGRHGRVWQSPEGGLWMTLALPDVPAEVVASAGLRVGVACGGVIEGLLGSAARVNVKWPNDLLIDERKVCGVLCEAFEHAGRSWLLVGVGINANNRPGSMSGPLRRPAGALVEWVRSPIDVRALGEAVARDVARSLTGALGRGVIQWAAVRLWRLDRMIGVRGADGERVLAMVRGLDDAGRLLIDVDGRRVVMAAGSEIEDGDVDARS